AHHELIVLGLAGLLQFGGAVAVVSLVNSVEFEQRVALAVKGRRRVGEVARQMAAQLAALLFYGLGLGNLLYHRAHVAVLQRTGGKSRLLTWFRYSHIMRMSIFPIYTF